MSHKYVEFAQDNHFVIMLSDRHLQPPMLSEGAVRELNLARHNSARDGWSTCFDYKVKKDLIQAHLLGRILYAECGADNKGVRHAIECKEFVWEAIRFVDFWVYDVYPFRDNRPE